VLGGVDAPSGARPFGGTDPFASLIDTNVEGYLDRASKSAGSRFLAGVDALRRNCGLSATAERTAAFGRPDLNNASFLYCPNPGETIVGTPNACSKAAMNWKAARMVVSASGSCGSSGKPKSMRKTERWI
jgi:hypothetical protein